MERSEILEKLKEIMLAMDPSKAEVVNSVTEDSRLTEDLGLTSVAILYMVIAIEETFNVSFDNLGINDFKTIGDSIDYIAKKVG